MRSLLLHFVFLCCLWVSSFAQNLTPNPGFERTNEITNNWMGTFSKFNKAMKFWNSPTQGSPDLIFVTVKDKMNPPRKGFDLSPHYPKSGKMMVGIKTHGCDGQVMLCREYLQTPLKFPLVVGMKYYIEFYADPMVTSVLTNNIGISFSTTYTRQLYAEGLYDYEPKVNHTQILKHTNQWTKISGSFVADSAYTFLIIGNFFPDAQTAIETSNAKIDYGFVFIDDIRLVRADQKHLSFADELDLENIQFEWDKSVLLPAAYKVLDELIILLKRDELLKIKIAGHTDDTGNDDYNQKLSLTRAKTVYRYLIGKGIHAERLQYIGYGATQFVATNDTEEGRQKNRRVVFEIVE